MATLYYFYLDLTSTTILASSLRFSPRNFLNSRKKALLQNLTILMKSQIILFTTQTFVAKMI